MHSIVQLLVMWKKVVQNNNGQCIVEYNFQKGVCYFITIISVIYKEMSMPKKCDITYWDDERNERSVK